MYLKKRKMYDLAVELLVSMDLFRQAGIEESPVPSMRCSNYKFYQGSEWLSLYIGDSVLKLYRCPSYVSIELVDYESNELLCRKLLNSNEYKVMISN